MKKKGGSCVIDIEVNVDANEAEFFRGRAQDPVSTVSGAKQGEQTQTVRPKVSDTSALRDRTLWKRVRQSREAQVRQNPRSPSRWRRSQKRPGH